MMRNKEKKQYECKGAKTWYKGLWITCVILLVSMLYYGCPSTVGAAIEEVFYKVLGKVTIEEKLQEAATALEEAIKDDTITKAIASDLTQDLQRKASTAKAVAELAADVIQAIALVVDGDTAQTLKAAAEELEKELGFEDKVHDRDSNNIALQDNGNENKLNVALKAALKKLGMKDNDGLLQITLDEENPDSDMMTEVTFTDISVSGGSVLSVVTAIRVVAVAALKKAADASETAVKAQLISAAKTLSEVDFNDEDKSVGLAEQLRTALETLARTLKEIQS